MALSFLRNGIFWFLHACGTIVAVLALAIVLLVARFAYGPFTITAPWAAHWLSGPYNGVKLSINQSTLGWNRDTRELTLDLNGIELTDPLDQKIGDVQQAVMVLKPLAIFNDADAPLMLAVRRPHINARFDTNGEFQLGVYDGQVKQQEAKPPVDLNKAKADLKKAISSPRSNAFGLGTFSNLNITEAELNILDQTEQVTWNISMPALILKRNHDDYKGVSRITIKRPDFETQMGFSLFYVSRQDRFSAAWAFEKLNPEFLLGHIRKVKFASALSAPITGTLTADFDAALHVYDANAMLEIEAGTVNIPDVYKEPLVLKSGRINAHYSGETLKVDTSSLKLELADTTITGRVTLKTAQQPWQVEGELSLNDLPVAKLPVVWPPDAGVNPRAWITENIHNGKIDLASVNFAATFPQAPETELSWQKVEGAINVSGADLKYWGPLPQLNKVSAKSTYDIHHFDIDVLSGEIGPVKLKPSHLTISGLDGSDQVMDLIANITGPARNIFTILDRDPLNYGKKTNIAPETVSGTADGELKMKFSLLKELPFDKIELTSATHISNGAITKVADKFSVSDANVDLAVNKDVANIKGKGRINGIASELEWNEIFSPPKDKPFSRASIAASATGDDIKKFGVDFEVHSAKAFPVQITYERWPDKSALNVKGDAKDTQLTIPDLSFTKPAGAAFIVETALEWGGDKPMRLPKLDITGTDIKIRGDGTFDKDQSLDRITLDPLQVGQTNAKLDYSREGQGHALVIKGSALDLRGFLNSSDPQKENAPAKPPAPKDSAASTPLRVDVQLDKIITGNGKFVTNAAVQGTRDDNGWSKVNASIMAGDDTPATVTMGPKDDGLTYLDVATPDLGKILDAFDVTSSMKGGKLAITGKSEAGKPGRVIFGHITVDKFEVSNLPVLAKLLGAISPDGLEALLSGRPLSFTELSGEYMWSKDALVINKAHTSAGSLGLTTEGKLTFDTNMIDLQGQVIPVYFISRIISSIPVIGDILTGGENGGMFAATYKVKGPLSKPDVSVNPVSILAPGILRDILFTDPNITKEKKK